MSNTCGCSRPTRAGYVICDTCKGELELHLAEMAWLDEELDISLTRVKGVDYNRSGRRGTDTPLPWNDRAADARSELKSELVGWFRIMWTKGEPIPADNLPDIAAWLLTRLERIAKREDAWVISEGIIKASIDARAVVFAKPEERTFIGPCEGRINDDGEHIEETECAGEVFGHEGSPEATCRECKRTYDVRDAIAARDAKIAKSPFMLMTLGEIARLAHRTFGQPEERVLNTVKSWRKRGQIMADTHTPTGADLFRYQDVIERLARVYGDAS